MSSAHSQFVRKKDYVRACSKFATGITIVTVRADDGTVHGMTANSFTSVSLDPPMVLVCIDHQARILPYCRACRYFAINVLRADQEQLSVRFSKSAGDRFHGVNWHAGQSGSPLLADSLAAFECEVSQRVEAGDHTILIGDVLWVDSHDGDPLVYFSSAYRHVK